MSTQLAMVIDSSKCFDCKGCVLSCKAANNVPDGFWRNWIKSSTPDFSKGVHTRTHFQPGGCMHCTEPTCVAACPTGATFRDTKNGVVVINSALCIGCGNCVAACPYDARFRNPISRKADKCDFCAARRARGLQPACVDTCPTKARVFGDINDPASNAAKLLDEHKGAVAQVIHPDYDTKPNMFYLAETLPTDWPRKAPPPLPMRAMTGVVSPLVQVAAVASGLGVLAMWARQLLAKRPGPHDDSYRNSKTSSETSKEASHD